MSRREIEWEKLIKEGVGPGALYDLYLIKYKGYRHPERVFRLNKRGRVFVERLRKRSKQN